MLARLGIPHEQRPFRRTGSRAAALLAALAGLALPGSHSLAEPDPPDRQGSFDMLAAHAVARAALVDLKAVGTPTQRDYRIAEEVLATASTLLPNDQTILRLYMEAASGADDTTAIRDIARRLVKLDPTDTVAQLRVISSKISELQTADERLAAYDRFVFGDGAEAFDNSVRSRLALDAALLYREQGDMGKFRKYLVEAINLDSTNKDAATLGLMFYEPKPEDGPTGRLDLLFELLAADPFDPSVYNSIISELLSRGAYKGALRFATLQRRLYDIQSLPLPEADEAAFDLVEWNALGPEPVIRRLSETLSKRRQAAFEQPKHLRDGSTPDATPRPDEIHLPVSRERSRILCTASLGDHERSANFLTEFAAIVDAMTHDAGDPTRRPPGVTEEQAREQARGASIDLLWLRLLCDHQVKEAGASLDELRKNGTLDGPALARLDAWFALRAGDRAKAERDLGALAPTDALAALGHAMAAELREDPNTALVRYADLVRRDPGDFVGAFAATRYTKLAGEHPPVTDVARSLEVDAAGVPQWLDGIVDNPRRVMALEVTNLRPDIVPIDRTPVRVVLRNTSDIALAVGSDKPLCSRLLFAPSVTIGADAMAAAGFVWVANIDRRLRLLPNESIDAIVWPDLGPLSAAMETDLPRQARVRWRVLQGFVYTPVRVFDSTPLMLSTDVPPLIRRIPYRTDGVFEALQLALRTGGPREIADVALALKLQIYQGKVVVSTLTGAQLDSLMEVLSLRCASGSLQRASKMVALCLLPSAAPQNVPQTLRLDQVASQDTDEDVLAVELAVRVFRPDDPIFTSPNVIKSTRLTALAQLVKSRLEAGVPCIATERVLPYELIGPGTGNPTAPRPAPDAPTDSDRSVHTNADTNPSRVISPSLPPDPNPLPGAP